MINPRLRPWFKLLLNVKMPFMGAVLCGALYGLSSGFGLPFMTGEVFPIIFASGAGPEEKSLLVQTGSGNSLPLHWREGWYLDQPVVFSAEPPGPDAFHTNNAPSATRLASSLKRPNLQNTRDDGATAWILNTEGNPVALTGPLMWRTVSPDDRETFKRVSPTLQDFLSKWNLNRWQIVLLTVALVPLTFAVRGLSSFLNVYLINYTGLKVLEDIRARMFDKLQDLEISFFTNHSQGDVVSRMFNDTTQLQYSVVNVANDLIKQPITFLGALGFLVFKAVSEKEVAFILFSLAIVPVCVLPIRYAGKKLLKKAFHMQVFTGKATSLVQENLSGHREVRAYNLQAREKARFREVIGNLFREQMKIVKYNSFLSPTIEVISAIGISVAIFYAAGKGITLEDFTSLIMALYMSYEPIKKLGAIHTQIKKGIASLDRIEEILHQPVRISAPENPQPFPERIESIQLDGLTFSYDGENPVLNNIEFEARMGQSIALVGASGAGKSTLAQMLCRFFDPTSGCVRINGIDIREFDPTELRRHMALVSQDIVLFNDSVMNNVKLGNLEASPGDVIAAADSAQASDFISQLPNGWDTSIGERGNKLSGGQKQRLSIARAFLKNAPVIILDEATSALDTESEFKVQHAMNRLIQGRMAWIIAHRLSTVRHADVIIVLDQGRIISTGTHDELMHNCEVYSQLVNRQSLTNSTNPNLD